MTSTRRPSSKTDTDRATARIGYSVVLVLAVGLALIGFTSAVNWQQAEDIDSIRATVEINGDLIRQNQTLLDQNQRLIETNIELIDRIASTG